MTFENELFLIKNPEIKQFAQKILTIVPDYFYVIPASSTGKYHPQYCLGEGGLYRHVQAAIKIACHMMRIEQCEFADDEKDIIIVSLMFHDCWKSGESNSGHTVHEHPLIAAHKIMQEINDDDLKYAIPVCENISSHMGSWTTSDKSNFILPKPKTEMQKFVHLCDYLASRKDIEVIL